MIMKTDGLQKSHLRDCLQSRRPTSPSAAMPMYTMRDNPHRNSERAERNKDRAELPVLTIANATAWSQWLSREAETSKGVWLTLAKESVTEPASLTYAEAQDEALCHGWIAGQARKKAEATCSHRFTPRTAKSIWSKTNVRHNARLENEGRMQARGSSEVEKAKSDGRWDAAYAGQAGMETPVDLAATLGAVPEAQATWDILTTQNRHAICFRLGALKTEAGRRERVANFAEMLARGETLHLQKQSRGLKAVTPGSSRSDSSPIRLSRAERSQRRAARLQ